MGLPQKKRHNGLSDNQRLKKILKHEHDFSRENYAALSLPEFVTHKWDKVLNLLSELGHVKVSLITKWTPEANETFVANSNKPHPYKKGNKDPHSEDFYCEKVIKSRNPLLIEDAANNPEWCNNPDLKKYNFGAYYGEPILWPNEQIFGTLCYMNDQITHFSDSDINLLSTCRESIEKDLQVYSQYLEIYSSKNELQLLNEKLERKVNERTRLLANTNEQVRGKNKELQKINHELDRFIYSASHGLKAPLTTMQGLINLCKVEKEKEKFSDTYLRMMENSVENLQNIIQNLSNYSLNARVSLRFTTIHLYSLIAEIVESLRFMPQMKHIQIEIEADKHFTFHSDEGRLKIIFYNLLSNAIKFYDPEKTSPFVRVRLVSQSPEIIIEIEDNGLGIPSDSQNKIFQLFYRATAVSEGPGMGLFIVRESLELLGGSVSVTSELGKGTTFKVTLPKGK